MKLSANAFSGADLYLIIVQWVNRAFAILCLILCMSLNCHFLTIPTWMKALVPISEECNKPLDSSNCNDHDGGIYCNSCYRKKFGHQGYGSVLAGDGIRSGDTARESVLISAYFVHVHLQALFLFAVCYHLLMPTKFVCSCLIMIHVIFFIWYTCYIGPVVVGAGIHSGDIAHESILVSACFVHVHPHFLSYFCLLCVSNLYKVCSLMLHIIAIAEFLHKLIFDDWWIFAVSGQGRCCIDWSYLFFHRVLGRCKISTQ